MIDPVNSPTVPAVGIQNSSASQQQGSEPEEAQQVTSQADSVSIVATETSPQENTSRTTIGNAEQARETANRIVNLLQAKPELAATAQGGQMSAAKADAYLRANLG